MTTQLTELQQDALIEIFNVGVGHAANSMSQIAGEEITLSVPRFDILQGADQAGAIRAAIHSQHICAVSQDITGSLDAKAFLIFPEGKTQEIVRRMLGESVSVEELNEMEQEALSEIGNIILNSCFSALSDVLQSSFQSSLPAYHLGSVDQILLPANIPQDDDLLMLLHIDFFMPSAHIDGYLIFLMTLTSFNALLKKIDQFTAGLHGN